MNSQLLSGSVEMLLLDVLSSGPSYGYEIVQKVKERSGGYFNLKEGSVYPALHRIESQKLLKSHWQQADGRRRKYYSITAQGRKALEALRAEWAAFSAGVDDVLGGSHG